MAKKRLKGRFYTPSKPGEFPHKDKGDLQRSINYTVNRTRKSVKLSASAEHGLYLEKGTKKMAPRPFLSRTVSEETPTLVRIFQEKVT